MKIEHDRTSHREFPSVGAGSHQPRSESDLPGPLGWLVDAAASVKANIHLKLLAGFLPGSLLLLAVGILSLWTINRMNTRAAELQMLFEQVNLAQQMEYEIPAQSHFRGMAILTRDQSNNDKIAASKERFGANLVRLEAANGSDQGPFFARVREANERFSASSARALSLYQEGNLPEALRVHLEEEHPISHELEAAMRELVLLTTENMDAGVSAIQADHRLVSTIVIVFAAGSIGISLMLGLVLSWSFVRPVRQMGQAMRRIASGEFTQPVQVANRDELGDLAVSINDTAQALVKLQEVALAEERARALRERMVRVTLAQEEERRRLSRELHDGLGPSLAAIGNRLRVAQQMIRTDPQRVEWDLEETAKRLKGHIQEIRDLIHDLRPLALDQLGLVEAVKQQMERFSQETGVRTSFTISSDVALDPPAEVTVFRVVQECLSNVQKHAKASQVEVRLQAQETGLEVTVEDDGQGFDPGEVVPDSMGAGTGLLGMRERAELLGGSLSVQSSPGSGSRIVMRIPSKEAALGAHPNPAG